MQQTYAFLFCIALGMAARFLYMGATALAKRTNLLPVTVILDALTVLCVGGGFTAYVILTGTVLAPYMFAALFAGYLFSYWLTRGKAASPAAAPEKPPRKKRDKRGKAAPARISK